MAGRLVRLWANLHSGRVIVQTDEPEPRDVGLAVNIDCDERPGYMMLNPQQLEWSEPAREQLLRAAITHFNRMNSSSCGSGAV
ncbi:hypothetical protein [Glycomyces halotolerans]